MKPRQNTTQIRQNQDEAPVNVRLYLDKARGKRAYEQFLGKHVIVRADNQSVEGVLTGGSGSTRNPGHRPTTLVVTNEGQTTIIRGWTTILLLE